MPVIAILVGFAAGLGVWGILDQVQSRQVGKIFSQELQAQLDLQARESLIRFDRYLATYGMTTRLLANHRRLAEYLEPLFWSAEPAVEPVVYREFRPYWLPDFFARAALRTPSHVLLADTRGRVREDFQSGSAPLPRELAVTIPAQFRDVSEVRTVPVRLEDGLYLLVSDAVEDSGGFAMGHLVVLVPIDDAFLAASQRGIDPNRAAVALVDGDDQRIVASLDPEALIPGTALDMWDEGFLVTSQSLSGYEGADSNLLFATFVTHASVDRMSRHVRIFERRQRFYAALAFILVFTGVIYLVSARLNRVLKRMTRFSQRALGIPVPGFHRDGNQLLLLEEWIKHFTQLVLKAREEMSRRHQAEMRESEALKAAMMEASLDSIVTLDHQGRIIEVNPAAVRVFGLEREEAIGAGPSPSVSCRAGAGRLPAPTRALLPGGPGAPRAGRAHGPACQRDRDTGGALHRPHRPGVGALLHPLHPRHHQRKQAEREIKSLARFAAESPSPILRVTRWTGHGLCQCEPAPLLLAWGTARVSRCRRSGSPRCARPWS
jgi:two-component system, LuxR family, sensor kinase FixL